jgi:hypothetical protein
MCEIDGTCIFFGILQVRSYTDMGWDTVPLLLLLHLADLKDNQLHQIPFIHCLTISQGHQQLGKCIHEFLLHTRVEGGYATTTFTALYLPPSST